jgi:hypothetical protein
MIEKIQFFLFVVAILMGGFIFGAIVEEGRCKRQQEKYITATTKILTDPNQRTHAIGYGGHAFVIIHNPDCICYDRP